MLLYSIDPTVQENFALELNRKVSFAASFRQVFGLDHADARRMRLLQIKTCAENSLGQVLQFLL